jgi:hypothetical protein
MNKFINIIKQFFIFSAVVLFGYYILFYPKLVISVNSNVKSVSQIFYQSLGKEVYSEEMSRLAEIKTGEQLISFEIPSYDYLLRLDFANKPYNITINEMYVRVLFFKIPIQNLVQYNQQIKNITYDNGKIKIETLSNATDPQVFIKADSKKVKLYRLVISFVFGLLALLVFILFHKIDNVISHIEGYILKFYENYIKNTINIKYFGIYIIIAIVFHLYEISNFLISIDDEYGAFRVYHEVWIEQGRWATYLFEKFVFSQPTMPFVPNLMFCILMSFSYVLFLKSHKIENNLKTLLLFPIYVAFPTLWFINEFYANTVVTSLGFVLSSLALFFFIKFLEKNETLKLKHLIFSSIFLAISIGIYQSFLMFFIVIVVGLYFIDVSLNLNNISIKNKRRYWIGSISILLIGLIIYLLLDQIFKFYFPSNSVYITSFLNFSVNFKDIFFNIFTEMFKVYSGSPLIYGVYIGSLGFLIILMIVNIVNRKNSKSILFILFLIILITPFSINILSGGNQLPTRSIVAIPYIFWLFSFIALSQKRAFLNFVGGGIILILQLQMLNATGQYAAATTIGQYHDRMFAADIYRRIAESNPNFDPLEKIKIDVYGYKSIETPYPSVQTSTIKASFFDWDAGNMSRMIFFMRLLGYSNLQMVDKEFIERNTLYFNKMPSYPNKESVQYVDGIYLIKLGDRPDVYRRK